MKTFRTLKEGDKIIMEHAHIPVQCNEVINGVTYTSKIDVRDMPVYVTCNPDKREDITDEMERENRMTHCIWVTSFGRLNIPYEYVDKDFCPNQNNGATARIVQN